jgi:hypothetical protein
MPRAMEAAMPVYMVIIWNQYRNCECNVFTSLLPRVYMAVSAIEKKWFETQNIDAEVVAKIKRAYFRYYSEAIAVKTIRTHNLPTHLKVLLGKLNCRFFSFRVAHTQKIFHYIRTTVAVTAFVRAIKVKIFQSIPRACRSPILFLGFRELHQVELVTVQQSQNKKRKQKNAEQGWNNQ